MRVSSGEAGPMAGPDGSTCSAVVVEAVGGGGLLADGGKDLPGDPQEGTKRVNWGSSISKGERERKGEKESGGNSDQATWDKE